MLNSLNNKNKQYITHEELQGVIQHILNQKYIRGNPGKDAVITKEFVSKVKKMVTPVKGVHFTDGEDGKTYELTEDDKIEIANYSMDRVKEHVLSDIISQDALVNLIRRQTGKDGLYVDNVRGLKKHINNIVLNNQSIHNVNESVQEHDETIHQLSDHISQLEINIAAGGSSAKGEETCETGPPTGPGETGDLWFDSTANKLYTWACGQWLCQDVVPFGTPVCVGIGTAAVGSTFEVGCLGNGGTVLPGQLQAPTVDGSITYNQPEISGVCPVDGNTITAQIHGVAVAPTAVCNAGTYSITPSAPIADGTYDFTVTQTDGVGSVSNLSPATNATITTVAPTGIGVMVVGGTFIIN